MSVADFARDYAQVTGLRAFVKTNLGPEIQVYDANAPDTGGGLAELLKLGVVVRDRTGKEVLRHGDLPATNPLLAGALLVAVAGAVFLMARGAASMMRG